VSSSERAFSSGVFFFEFLIVVLQDRAADLDVLPDVHQRFRISVASPK
jgi:hypothetical protein